MIYEEFDGGTCEVGCGRYVSHPLNENQNLDKCDNP